MVAHMTHSEADRKQHNDQMVVGGLRRYGSKMRARWWNGLSVPCRPGRSKPDPLCRSLGLVGRKETTSSACRSLSLADNVRLAVAEPMSS
jgi:hypothetical protein